jgi:hypothetical protein
MARAVFETEPVALTVYCEPPTTLHRFCNGYTIAATDPTGKMRDCTCGCHQDGGEGKQR